VAMQVPGRSRLRGVAVASAFAVLSLALGGASCDKKSVASAPDPGPSVPFEAPKAPAKPEVKAEQAPPAAKPQPAPAPAPAPAPTAAEGGKFDALAEKLPSPCGKAESLKKSLSDASCKSAPFAKRFVEHMLRLEAAEDDLTELYRNRFGPREERNFNLRETPVAGTPNAPVAIVEFYDYACPYCREVAPVLEQVVAAHPGDVALYYKQYPIHKESMDLAKGALAAHRQGKFKDVHLKLFRASSREDVMQIAKESGLDMERFTKDFNDPSLAAKITADRDEAQKAKLQGTPTIYINNRMYVDALSGDRFADWIEEELALNR
jgi:predicted DsbA family dithiol-disulfide isomerase